MGFAGADMAEASPAPMDLDAMAFDAAEIDGVDSEDVGGLPPLGDLPSSDDGGEADFPALDDLPDLSDLPELEAGDDDFPAMSLADLPDPEE